MLAGLRGGLDRPFAGPSIQCKWPLAFSMPWQAVIKCEPKEKHKSAAGSLLWYVVLSREMSAGQGTMHSEGHLLDMTSLLRGVGRGFSVRQFRNAMHPTGRNHIGFLVAGFLGAVKKPGLFSQGSCALSKREETTGVRVMGLLQHEVLVPAWVASESARRPRSGMILGRVSLLGRRALHETVALSPPKPTDSCPVLLL